MNCFANKQRTRHPAIIKNRHQKSSELKVDRRYQQKHADSVTRIVISVTYAAIKLYDSIAISYSDAEKFNNFPSFDE